MEKTIGKDLTQGSIVKQIIGFAFPVIVTLLLSLFFNIADIAVLGIFCDDNAVAGAGANGSLIELIIGLFTGVSTGANVMVAKALGQRNQEKVRKTIGTSLVFAFFSSLFLMAIGFFGAETFEIWMGCAPEVMDYAVKYLKIYFLGIPIILLYNFVASILRAMGDSFHPMLYLGLSGIINVGLNVFFVAVLKMTVEGVAIATVISQGFALVLSTILLIKNKGMAKLEAKYLRFFKKELIEILKVGIPCGIQGSLFSISNVIIQSTVNSFGAQTMTANAIGARLDALAYYTGYGISIATLSIVSQNYGAKNFARIKETVFKSILICILGNLIAMGIGFAIKNLYLNLMTNDPVVIEDATIRLTMMLLTYWICGIMESLTSSLRGIGYSTLSMAISVFGTIVVRLFWIFVFVNRFKTLFMLYLTWPISWVITIAIVSVVLIIMFKREKNKGLEINSD